MFSKYRHYASWRDDSNAAVEHKPRLVSVYGSHRRDDQPASVLLSNLKYMTVGDLSTLRGVDLTPVLGDDAGNECLPRNSWNGPECFGWYLHKAKLMREMSGDRMKDVGIVTTRDDIKRVLASKAFRHCTRWTGTLLCGSIYLNFEYEPRMRSYIHRDVASYLWSHQFFQYMLSDRPDTPPDSKKPLQIRNKFMGIFDLHLKDNRILYKSVIDGIYSATDEDQNRNPIESSDEKQLLEELHKRKFVKLSSTSMINDMSHKFRRYKTEELWTLGFLAGAEKLYLGFKEGNMLTEVSEYDISTLLEIKQGWCPQDLLQFFDKTLNYMKECFEIELKKMNYSGDLRKAPLISLSFEGVYPGIVECKGISEQHFSEEYVKEIQKFF